MSLSDYTRTVQEPPVPVLASVDAYMLAEMIDNLTKAVTKLTSTLRAKR